MHMKWEKGIEAFCAIVITLMPIAEVVVVVHSEGWAPYGYD